MSDIRVGTASWTDRTLLASGWYPKDVTTPDARLRYYAEQFPIVEVDSTYYTPPNERNSELWASRTPEQFRFHIKAFSLFTGHPTRTAAIYKDLRPDTSKRSVYPKDLAASVVDQAWERFRSALEPLWYAGKLAAILFQFPPWFFPSKEHRTFILECQRRAQPYPISVEFRNAGWLDERSAERTLDFLRSYALPFVCVDMPQGYRSSVPPVMAVTNPELSVVRFHGHSTRWESHDIHERFGYRYSEAELREWAPRISRLAEQAASTHVLMNNCYRDYAQVNARQLVDLLPRG